jgi:hypothetical protein
MILTHVVPWLLLALGLSGVVIGVAGCSRRRLELVPTVPPPERAAADALAAQHGPSWDVRLPDGRYDTLPFHDYRPLRDPEYRYWWRGGQRQGVFLHAGFYRLDVEHITLIGLTDRGG